jgi:hypothetical protein
LYGIDERENTFDLIWIADIAMKLTVNPNARWQRNLPGTRFLLLETHHEKYFICHFFRPGSSDGLTGTKQNPSDPSQTTAEETSDAGSNDLTIRSQRIIVKPNLGSFPVH